MSFALIHDINHKSLALFYLHRLLVILKVPSISSLLNRVSVKIKLLKDYLSKIDQE